MGNNKYLPIGSIIGDNYEIVDILGEDDFEILYLVRDTNRIGSFFVIKELFLETFSSRENYSVSNIPEAQGVFEKRKQEIISEIKESKKNPKIDEIKTYGYIEQNNTIYTIMGYNNNLELIDYLQFQPKEARTLPSLEELLTNSQKQKKSFPFLKILIALLILTILTFYTYRLFQEKQLKTKEQSHPILMPHVVQEYPSIENQNSKEQKEKTTLQTKETKIEELNISKKPVAIVKIEEKKPLPKPVIVQVTEPSQIADKNISQTVESNESIKEILVQKEEKTKVAEEIFTKSSVKLFLDKFIKTSASGSIEEILSNYDRKVHRYFKLKNVNHKTIRKDKERYHRKWAHRQFSIENFEILKTYTKENSDYCDVKTITKWTVSSKYGKKASGKSKGFMTLKKVEDGFKVTSIYTLK